MDRGPEGYHPWGHKESVTTEQLTLLLLLTKIRSVSIPGQL